MTSQAIAHQRETAFHDKWAASTPLEEMQVRECFEAPTALEIQLVLIASARFRRKKVLDIGAGLGESSVYLRFRARRSP